VSLKEHYLVIQIENDIPDEFRNLEWKFKDLKNWKTNRQSAEPYTASLTELLKNKA